MYILTLENKEGYSVQTDFIVSSFQQREVLHQGLKQADDSIRLQVPFSAEIWNFLNANKLIKAKITKDGESYFTGYVRPDFDYSKVQRFQPIQLELVNATYITSFYEIEESIAYKDTTLGTIVSDLLERAEITGQDTSFLDEPIVFDIIEEGTTVKDALSQILFEYGYFWDFDKNGEFTVQPIYNENVTPSVVLDGTNILEKVQVSKKEQEFDRVEVEYEHYEKFDKLLLFQDNTGKKGGGRGCFIDLKYGKYLGAIEGEKSYDITYDSDKGEVIWVDNASLSILANPSDKLQTTFTNKNTKGNLSIYNPTTGSIYILLLEVYGTAYVKTIESATVKVGQDGKNKSIKSKYIHSKEAAENFAKMYYDWGKSCDYAISLQSKLNLDVGTIVEVNAAGKIIGRVIEKTTKLDGKPYTYKIEAIKEYELPKITSSILRKSSPIGTAARGTGILKIDTAPTAYTTPVSGITPSYRISKDVVKSQSLADEVYTGDILQYSYYQYQVILVADDYVYTAERTSIRGSVGATGAIGAPGTKTFFSDYNRTWTNEEWNRNSTVGFTDTWSNSTVAGMRIGDTFVITATLSEKGNIKGQIFTQITGIDNSNKIITSKTVSSLIGEKGDTGATGATGAPGTKTFFADYNRTWTNEEWNRNSTVGFTDTWSNSTVAGMRVGDTFVITATLSEKGNSKGQIFTQITSIPTSINSSGSYEITSKTVASLIGERGAIGPTGQRGGIDLAITTAPAAYTTTVGGFTPSYRIALSTVKTQSGISTVYVGDTLVYGVYRYPVGHVDSSYVYTAARTSVKGDAGTKTFFSDYNRTWTNEEWNRNSTVGFTDTWSNSTVDGMRIGDTFVITATLSEKGNSKGQIFTQIISISTSNSSGSYEITSKTVASLIGETGASSRTIAYRINYAGFAVENDGEMYVCGYNSAGAQADIPGYVIVNGAIHFIKGVFNPNVPINGYVVAEIGGTADSPKTPLFAFFDWGYEKYYKIENGQEPAGKTWEQLFTEITDTSNYIVLGKVSSSNDEGPLMFEEKTPCLLSSVTEEEENFVYQGVVATTTDMHTSITPYEFSQDAYGNWIKTALPTKTVKKWSFVLCMNAETPTSSTATPVMKVFTGTWWYEIQPYSAYYSSLQSMAAGDLPAVAGYYDTLGLSVPSICGTYIKTLTSNKAFINELFANDITVGNKIRSSNNNFIIDNSGNATLKSGTVGGLSIDSSGISTPFTPETGLRCYVEYSIDDTTTPWTTDLSKVYNSSTTSGTSQYIMRFGYKVPGLSTQIPVYKRFNSIVGISGAQYAFSTVDSPYTIPSSWTDITKNSFPRNETIDTKYKYLFIKLGYLGPNSPEIYALPCYTTSTRSDGFEINSDGSATFTGKTRFEGGIGIVCDAKDIVRNSSDGLVTVTYHFPMDFKIYDVIIFLEPNTSQGGTILLYKFTCVQYNHYGRPGMNVYKIYDNTSNHSTVIEASVEDDPIGYDSQQLPNGYTDHEHSNMQKVVIKQKTPNFPIASVKGVIIPYME